MPLDETCPYCGAEVSPQASKCRACGEYLDEVDTRRRRDREPESEDDSGFMPPRKRAGAHGTAVASLILGIISLFSWFCPVLGFGTTIAGLITGFVALSKRGPKGMAIAGIILSGIGLILSIINSAAGVWLQMQQQQGKNPFGP